MNFEYNKYFLLNEYSGRQISIAFTPYNLLLILYKKYNK